MIGQAARAALLTALDECDSESAEMMLQREALEVDLARVAKLRASIVAVLAELGPAADDAAAPVLNGLAAVPETGKHRTNRAVDCPDCGATMGSPSGLAMHRKHKHSGTAAAPAPEQVAAKNVKRDRFEAACVAREAHEAGTSMRQAVATALGMSAGAADQLIAAARNEGHDIPTGRNASASTLIKEAPPLAAPPAAELADDALALRCGSCDWVTAPDRHVAMIQHCSAEHHRRPDRAERTPSRAGDDAA